MTSLVNLFTRPLLSAADRTSQTNIIKVSFEEGLEYDRASLFKICKHHA